MLWHKRRAPEKDCSWVARDIDARCGFARNDRGAKGAGLRSPRPVHADATGVGDHAGEDGTFASDACPACARGREPPAWASGLEGTYQLSDGGTLKSGKVHAARVNVKCAA